jgi:hypothetical protein
MKTTGIILDNFQIVTDRNMENGSKKVKITQGLALSPDTWENLAIIAEFFNRSRNNLIESCLLDLIQKTKKEHPDLAKKLF